MSSPGGLQPAGPPRARGIHAGFEPASDIWRIVLEKGVTHICFKPIRDHWGDRHADNAKQAALAYMEDRSPDTVNGGVGALARMARHVPVGGTVSAAALMDYRSLLPREQLHYLGHIAAFLKFWVARGYTGVDRDVLQFFNSIKIPGNAKGAAVRTHHPTKGPFTDLELQGITLAARDALTGVRSLPSRRPPSHRSWTRTSAGAVSAALWSGSRGRSAFGRRAPALSYTWRPGGSGALSGRVPLMRDTLLF